jgi:hypothetical protein
MAALQLTNKCGRFIDSVYIRESGESSWGSDRLSQNDYLETWPKSVIIN